MFKLKDKADPLKKAHAIYQIPCKSCDQSYIGETTRPTYVRLKEHKVETEKLEDSRSFTRKQKKESRSSDFKSAIAEHAVNQNHVIDWEETKCLEFVEDWRLRGIKEAIHIRKTVNNMNRPQGERFQLSHIWDTLLTRNVDDASQSKGRGAHSQGASKPGPTRSQGKGPRGRGRRF